MPKRSFDQYPNLRKQTLARAVRKGARPLSRRDRVISEVLLRHARRWDTYAARVRSEGLDGDASAKTLEWRLILQNSRLLRWARKLPEDVRERRERWDIRAREATVAENRRDPVLVSTMPPHTGVRSTERTIDSVGD